MKRKDTAISYLMFVSILLVIGAFAYLAFYNIKLNVKSIICMLMLTVGATSAGYMY